MKCPTCRKSELKTHKEDHQYIAGVMLLGTEIRTCPGCGERLTCIYRVDDLHRVIAFAFAEQEARLAPDQVRFMRKYLGWSGGQFADIMGVAAETVSRWENGAQEMTTPHEKLLRVLVERLRPLEEYPNEELALVAKPGVERHPLRLEVTKRGWVEASAGEVSP